MAHRTDAHPAIYGRAVALLLAGVALHYGWVLVPEQHQAQAWNAAGAIVRAGLLLAVVWHTRSRWILLFALWWVLEEALVAGCSFAFILQPWDVAPGEAQCSALFQHDLGVYGLAAIAILAYLLPAKSDS